MSFNCHEVGNELHFSTACIRPKRASPIQLVESPMNSITENRYSKPTKKRNKGLNERAAKE